MAFYRIKNVAASNAQNKAMVLNINSDSVSPLSNNQNVTLWEACNSVEQNWKISSLSSGVTVYSCYGSLFALNAYRSGTNWNCDVYPAAGNATDSQIDFIVSGNYYKIRLTNYSNYYLTANGTSNGTNVYWSTAAAGDYQLWDIEEFPALTNHTYPTTIREMSQVYLGTNHPAIDIGATIGTPVYAFADGKVSFVQSFSGNWSPYDSNPPYPSTSMLTMGNCIAINHDNPNEDLASGDYARTIYMHLKDAPSLSEGDEVHKGDLIGYIGNTGRSSGPHLHFALAVGSAANMAPGYEGWVQISTLAPIDPRVYLPDYVDNI